MAYWRRYGWRGMGGISPQDAANQVVTQAQFQGAKMTAQEMAVILQSAQTGQLPFGPANWHSDWNCSGQQSGTAKIVTTASGMGVSIGGSVAALAVPAAIPVIGIAVAGAEALIGLFASIFAHHAQAVAREENVLCQAVPAVNQALAAVYDAVANGTITPAAGIATLQNVQSEFQQAVAGIIKDDASHCNAACVWLKCVEAAVLVKQGEYQDQIAAQRVSAPATAPAGSPGASSGGGMPSWALPAAAALAIGFLVFR